MKSVFFVARRRGRVFSLISISSSLLPSSFSSSSTHSELLAGLACPLEDALDVRRGLLGEDAPELLE